MAVLKKKASTEWARATRRMRGEAMATSAVWAALAISMLTDPPLRQLWADWVQGRQERHRATDGTQALAAIRLAADGIWLADLTGVTIEQRTDMRDFLIRQTRVARP